MFNDSIIKTTGQWWKAVIAFWGITLGGTIMFIGLANLESRALAMSLVLAGIFIGMISFIFGCVSIRCPRCNAPWVWQGVSEKSHTEWLQWLLNQPKCPKCEYDYGQADDAIKK